VTRRVRRGVGWTLILGDAITWLRAEPAARFDGLVTDPPYSSGGFTRGDRTLDPQKKYRQSGSLEYAATFDGDNRDQRSFTVWASIWLAEAHRVVRPGAPACVFSDWRQLPATTDAFQVGGFVWRGVAPWCKANASRPQKGRFRSDAEFVVCSRGAMALDRAAPVLRGSWNVAPVHSSRRVHLTEKPVDVMREIVRIVPRRGTVLDPFAGSGSTGVACLLEGRAFVGVEHNPDHFRTAAERLRRTETEIAARRRP
jgi:site-specific DNA-methyltransferase (adenine-specific)